MFATTLVAVLTALALGAKAAPSPQIWGGTCEWVCPSYTLEGSHPLADSTQLGDTHHCAYYWGTSSSSAPIVLPQCDYNATTGALVSYALFQSGVCYENAECII